MTINQINPSDPTIFSNYLYSPYIVKTNKWQQTAGKIVAICVHVVLGIATCGIFTLTAKYLSGKRIVVAGVEPLQQKEKIVVQIQFPYCGVKESREFDSIDDLRTHIEVSVKDKMHITHIALNGKGVRGIDGIKQKQLGPHQNVLHILTVPAYTQAELIMQLGLHPFIGKISSMKPVATEESGQSIIGRNLQQYNPKEQQSILDTLSQRLSRKTGEEIIIKISQGTNRGLIYYSKPHLARLAEAADKTIEEALQILSIPQQQHTKNMDFVMLAFGDLTGNSANKMNYDDLTAQGKIWYQKYFQPSIA